MWGSFFLVVSLVFAMRQLGSSFVNIKRHFARLSFVVHLCSDQRDEWSTDHNCVIHFSPCRYPRLLVFVIDLDLLFSGVDFCVSVQFCWMVRSFVLETGCRSLVASLNSYSVDVSCQKEKETEQEDLYRGVFCHFSLKLKDCKLALQSSILLSFHESRGMASCTHGKRLAEERKHCASWALTRRKLFNFYSLLCSLNLCHSPVVVR